MDKKEQVFKAVTDMINESIRKGTEETIQDTIYESFPMTKVECSYKSALNLLIIRIRYFCYGESLELNIKYTDITSRELLTNEFIDRLICQIDDKIKEKIAEKEDANE